MTTRIQYIDDYGPLGIRVYPTCPYPRRYESYDLGRIGSIELAESMTEREWAFLMQWLELTRDAGRVVTDAA